MYFEIQFLCIHLLKILKQMKKILLLIISVVTLISCGRDKSEETVEEVVETKVDKFYLEIEGTFEKNDSLVVFYQKDNYFKYEEPFSTVIKGSPQPQKFKIAMPEGTAVENFSITISTNKEQSNVTITNISIFNNDEVVVDGREYKFSEYFLTDSSFTWDNEKSNFKLNHDNKYPPGLTGSEKLLAILVD